MTHSVRRKRFSTVLLVAFLAYHLQMPGLARAAALTLPAGTIVTCRFEEPIDPVTVTVGRRITLRIVNPVVVDGQTVIEANAPVIAEVTQAQKQGSVGKPAIIGVTLRTVTAVDGTTVALSGSHVVEGENKQTTSLVVTILCCVLGLIMKGGAASIAQGTQVDGSTLAAVSVTVG